MDGFENRDDDDFIEMLGEAEETENVIMIQ